VKGFKTLTLLDKKAQPERVEKRLKESLAKRFLMELLTASPFISTR
jgi:hypothetical protein